MELGQLRYFLKAAELQNFTRAAQVRGVSQPALSQQILKPEEELGRPVFERQGRRVELTKACELLKERAEQILALVDDAKDRITDDGTTGRLRISAIPTIALYLLPEPLRLFRETYPQAGVEVNEDTTDILLRRCSQGEIDIGLSALPVDARYLAIEPLFDEELVLAVPPDHLLATQKRVTIADVHNEPFVLLREAHRLTENVMSFCRQKSFQPLTTGRASQLAMVQELVALGHGVSPVPMSAARIDETGRRIYRLLAGDKPKRTIALCWNPYRFQSRPQVNFMSQLKQLLQHAVR